MAIARDTTVANIKPLNGAVVRRFTAGAALVPGELCSMQSDGKVDPSDCTSAADGVIGVALPREGVAAYADGDAVDVVVFGPVKCLTGATIGAVVYNSTTAGEPSESGGGNTSIAGWTESATVLFVNPTPA